MISKPDAGAGQRLVEGARALYADRTAELATMIERLRNDYMTEETKGLADALKSHRKALQTLLDFELADRQSEKEADTDHDLDLDAAREEALGRLDRLAAARSDGEAD